MFHGRFLRAFLVSFSVALCRLHLAAGAAADPAAPRLHPPAKPQPS